MQESFEDSQISKKAKIINDSIIFIYPIIPTIKFKRQITKLSGSFPIVKNVRNL